MALAISEVQRIVERACAQEDVLDACARCDLSVVITVLNAHGLTTGQIAELTGTSQGLLSEFARHQRIPRTVTTLKSFADALGLPPAARQPLGLAAAPVVSAATTMLWMWGCVTPCGPQ